MSWLSQRVGGAEIGLVLLSVLLIYGAGLRARAEQFARDWRDRAP